MRPGISQNASLGSVLAPGLQVWSCAAEDCTWMQWIFSDLAKFFMKLQSELKGLTTITRPLKCVLLQHLQQQQGTPSTGQELDLDGFVLQPTDHIVLRGRDYNRPLGFYQHHLASVPGLWVHVSWEPRDEAKHHLHSYYACVHTCALHW